MDPAVIIFAAVVIATTAIVSASIASHIMAGRRNPRLKHAATASMLYSEGQGPRCSWRCRYERLVPNHVEGAWTCPRCGRSVPFGEEESAPWPFRDEL